jgi:hypothetical protein
MHCMIYTKPVMHKLGYPFLSQETGTAKRTYVEVKLGPLLLVTTRHKLLKD